MGFARGSEIAVTMINSLKRRVKDKAVRKEVYKELIGELDSHDWDTHDEAMGYDPVFDAAMKEVNPDDDFGD